MRPNGIEDLAAFSAREVKKQQQRKEKETSIPVQRDSESQCRRQSRSSELSEN